MTRTEVLPRRCPSMRFLPRDLAQRPLPSMIMAIWAGRRFLSKPSNSIATLASADSSLRQVTLKRPGKTGRQTEDGTVTARTADLYRHDLFFLAFDNVIDPANEFVSNFLHSIVAMLR